MIEVLPGKADGPHPTDLVRIDSGFTKRPDRRPRGDRRVAERLLDLALASTALGLALPLLGLVGPILLATQGPPLFYRQVRVGRNGTLFTMVKVRTMHRAAERETGPVWATPGDPRVTRLGAFLRRTHLDEVPQFWNVLRGEMSLIGPRPERPEFVGRLTREIPGYAARLRVRPGITGLAQVRGGYDDSLRSVRRKLRYDLFHMRARGVRADLAVLLWTVARVASGIAESSRPARSGAGRGGSWHSGPTSIAAQSPARASDRHAGHAGLTNDRFRRLPPRGPTAPGFASE